MSTSTEELQTLLNTDNHKEDKLDGGRIPPQKTLVAEEVQSTIENTKSVDLAEEVKAKLKVVDEDTKEGNLNKIKITKEVFEDIRKSLTETVKSMEKNPSLFSRAAKLWGELPLWQKILGGVALTLPTLIIGIVAHIGFLLAICGVTAVTYAAGGIILDDHHKCSTSIVESLQKGILGLADLLELTINALDIIRQQLANEIEKFVTENERLTESITSLSQKIDVLDEHVRATAQITEDLGTTKDGLDQVIVKLKGHTDLLELNQQKLAHITKAYNANLSQLASKIEEINSLKVQLADEIHKARLIVDSLNAAIMNLTEVAIGDEEQREAFKQKLDQFLSDKEASFHQITDRICEAEKKLEATQRQLDEANQRYQELLKVQEKHIERLEGIGQPSSPEMTSVGEALTHSGIFAQKKELPVTNETEPSETLACH